MAARTAASATIRAVKGARRTLIPSKAPIVLTPSAVKQAQYLMQDQPQALGLKIGVKTYGCSGLSYILDYCYTKGKFDEEVSVEGIKIFIDSKAQLTLLGTEMDFIDNKLGSEFVFNNPNIKGTCGCGESFML